MMYTVTTRFLTLVINITSR